MPIGTRMRVSQAVFSQALIAELESAWSEPVQLRLSSDGEIICRPPEPPYSQAVQGHCPACGGSLRLSHSTRVTCRDVDCPDPGAAHRTLCDD